MVKVWCEWDMWFECKMRIDDYTTMHETREDAITALEKADWSTVDYNNWQEVEADGLLSIEEA